MKPLFLAALFAGAVGAASSEPLAAPRPAAPPGFTQASTHRSASLLEPESSCKIKFVGPGEQCGDYGTCPETAHRSFLWGLIEYDTDIVLCWCLVECDISF